MNKWTKILIEFLKIDTTNPPGKNYRKAVDFLEPLFDQAGFKTKQIKIPLKIAKGRVNLLAHRRNPGKPRLLVYAHIDVVPADNDWQPFLPKIKDNKIYARGVADMKGPIIAFLSAAEKIKNKNWPWDTTVMVTTDEETNQKEQLEYLLNKKIDNARGAVLLCLDSAFGYVSIGGLGHTAVKITVYGKSVHSGIAHLGVNAIEQAIPLLNALYALKTKVVRRHSEIPANPFLKIKTLKAGLNISLINGGLKVNIIPDRCEMQICRRTIPEESNKKAYLEIKKALDPFKKKVKFKLELLHEMEGYGKISPAAEKMAECMKEVDGQGRLYGVMGSGDLFTMATDYQWQMVGCGVGRDKESHFHGRHENARLKDIQSLSKILQLFLTSGN